MDRRQTVKCSTRKYNSVLFRGIKVGNLFHCNLQPADTHLHWELASTVPIDFPIFADLYIHSYLRCEKNVLFFFAASHVQCCLVSSQGLEPWRIKCRNKLLAGGNQQLNKCYISPQSIIILIVAHPVLKQAKGSPFFHFLVLFFYFINCSFASALYIKDTSLKQQHIHFVKCVQIYAKYCPHHHLCIHILYVRVNTPSLDSSLHPRGPNDFTNALT